MIVLCASGFFLALYGIKILYAGLYIPILAFSFIVWLVTRPYIWLDALVQQKKLESTLIALGIIIAIIGEILDRYYVG